MSKRVAVIIETVRYTVDIPDDIEDGKVEEWWCSNFEASNIEVEERTIDIREEGE